MRQAGSTNHLADSEPELRVVKIGGSLASTPYLKNWLDILAGSAKHRIVIVPGGGGFADQVRNCQREWKFDDRTAHCMALLAMQQYGLMIASFNRVLVTAGNFDEIRAVLAGNRVAVWLPDVEELDQAGIPAIWEVTSDSLSAWLAGRLAAKRLMLVKSARPASAHDTPEKLASNGIVDASFPAFLKTAGAMLDIFHCSEYRDFATDCKHRLGSNPIAKSFTDAR